MNTSPSSLPVCAFDGRCYRKNPQHFQQFSHPTQYPNQGTIAASASPTAPPATVAGARIHQTDNDTPHDVDDDDDDGCRPPTPTLKRSRSEDHPTHVEEVSDGEDGRGVSKCSVAESDMASPALLLHFLKHAPHRAILVANDTPAPLQASTSPSTGGLADLPTVGAAYCWAGAAEVLSLAYAGMGFHAADVQCVLTAASALAPSDPLAAFPGWRLVGPFELVVRYGQRCSCGGGDVEKLAAARVALVGGEGSAKAAVEEVRRWRCGRFRFDPPECQCVAVRVDTAANATFPASVNESGQHLCFHRDDPAGRPGLLVEGTAASSKFELVQAEGSLASYLCAWYHAQGDAPARSVVQALKNALHTLSTGPGAASDCTCLIASFADSLTEQKRRCAKRRKAWVAPTYSGLGCCVPVDPVTEVGYREPNIPANVSFAKYLRDCEAHFVRSVDAGGSGGGLAGTPFSRSAQHGGLAEAQPFTTKRSDCLDDVFLWADVANDEGDFGTSLQLGLNAFACIAADRCVVAQLRDVTTAASTDLSQQQRRRGETEKIDPVLWHTFRLLDCAYMLLQRPLYRHILRCHLPLLASAEHPVLFEV